MHLNRKLIREDAFARAMKACFGEQTSLAKIEEPRRLYARYRTDDVFEQLKSTGDKNNESGKP